MEHDELKKQNNKLFDDYQSIECQTFRQITGDSLDEKIQKANYEVNKNIQKFFDSEEYKNMENNLEDYIKKCRNSESERYDITILQFDNRKSYFYMYIDEKKVDYLETDSADETYAVATLDTGDNMFINMSTNPVRPCIGLKGADRITVGYEDEFPLNDFNGYEQNYISGQDLYNMLCKFPDKSIKISKSKGDLAESALHIEKEPSEIQNEKSPAD